MKNEKKPIPPEVFEKTIQKISDVMDPVLKEYDLGDFAEAVYNGYQQRVFEDEGFKALNFLYELSTPAHKKKQLGLSACLSYSDDGTLLALIQFFENVIILAEISESKLSKSEKQEVSPHFFKGFGQKFLDEARGEMWERVQEYRNDITVLENVKEAAHAG